MEWLPGVLVVVAIFGVCYVIASLREYVSKRAAEDHERRTGGSS